MKSTLDRFIDRGFKGLEVVMVLLLVGMVLMVFGNVVLRYAEGWFSDFFRAQGWPGGISISDEMSRYFFVWLTFIGAVVVHREHAHLGVETLVKALPHVGRRWLMAASDALVLLCCAVFFWGTWKQHGLNATNVAPISGMPMTWVYGIGYFTSIGIGIMTLARLYRNLTNTIDEAEVKIFAGDWDEPAAPGSVKGKME
jgi:TRAP-type transport system small permease protein